MKRVLLVGVLAGLLVAAPVSARDIHREGTAALRSVGDGFDLDAGVPRSPTRPSADIYRDLACVDPLSVEPAGECHVVLNAVFGQAVMTGPLASRPSYRTCRGRTYDGGAQDSDPERAWYCVQTSAGRYARLKVTHWPAPGAPRLRFSYRVWV